MPYPRLSVLKKSVVFLLTLFFFVPAQAREKIGVVATIAQIADPIRAIAGDHFAVQNIMGEGIDPHTYRLNRQDVAALNKADFILYSGLFLEAQMQDTLARLAKEKSVFAVAESLDSGDFLPWEEGHEFDPHVWMDIRRWSKAIGAAADELARVFPDEASAILKRKDRYLSDLDALANYAEKILATVPEQSRVIVSSHDAFNYFAESYGFEAVGIQGISTASEAGLKRIEEIVNLLVEKDIKSIFVESSVSERNVMALIEGAAARGHQVSIGGTLYSDAMGAAGTYEGTYIGMLDSNVTVIARALGGKAPLKGVNGKLSNGG